MINTILIVTCTVINCLWGLFWLLQLDKQFNKFRKLYKRKKHLELCLRCIEVGSCTNNCAVCAWGDVMTERQLNQEKKVRKFWKKIIE